MEATPITDDWLTSVQFKWRQEERQPNKHYSLGVNQFARNAMSYGTATIEVQRSGWKNQKGDYVGDPKEWMCWLSDQFNSRVFVGHIHSKEQVISLAEIVSGHEWNVSNHTFGQTWPDDRHIQEKPA